MRLAGVLLAVAACLAATGRAHTLYEFDGASMLEYHGGLSSPFPYNTARVPSVDVDGAIEFVSEVQFKMPAVHAEEDDRQYIVDHQQVALASKHYWIVDHTGGNNWNLLGRLGAITLSVGVTISRDEWHVLRVSRDAAGDVRFELDDVLLAPAANSLTPMASTGANPLYVGRPYSVNDLRFYGEIGFVRYSTRVEDAGTFPALETTVERDSATQFSVRLGDEKRFGAWWEQTPAPTLLAGAGGAGNQLLIQVGFTPDDDGSVARMYVFDTQPVGCYLYLDSGSAGDDTWDLQFGCPGALFELAEHRTTVTGRSPHTATLVLDGSEFRTYLDGALFGTTTGVADSAVASHDALQPYVGTFSGSVSYTLSNHHFIGDIEFVRVSSDPSDASRGLVSGCPSDAAAAAPAFDVAGSTVTGAGALSLRWDVSPQYETARLAFVGAGPSADAACSMQLPQAAVSPLDEAPVWDVAGAGTCNNVWTFTRGLADTLGACGFAAIEDDPDFTEFRATVEVTTVEDTGAQVFGQAVKQTRTTATEFGVRVPKSVSVTSDDVQAFPGFAGLEVDGRSFAVVSTQAYNVDTETFTLRVITAVAWPYVLELDGTTPVARSSGSNDWTLGASFQGGDCDGGAAVDNVCVQQWDLTLARLADCEVDGEYDLNFDVRCSDAFGNGDGCETHENPTAKVTIPVESDSVCARVVEVATVTPTLVTSTSQGGSQATDFVLQTTLYGRVSVAAEGGIATTAVVLTDLEIDSDCSSCAGSDGDKRNPFSDASPLASTYSWSTTPGVTFADFEFQLNANSVPFDTGAGQASITLTATVAVTYDEAGDQRTETRRVRMQAGGGETASARATASFGVGSAPGAAGGSSSTAGSTVLGVSTGTAMVAAVGLVAVVAIAAGVAVTRRTLASDRAKRAAAAKLRHSSSTADVSSAAVQLDVRPAVDASSLGGVQEAYGSIGQ